MLKLLKATINDAQFLYDLRHDKATMLNSIQTQSFSFEDHLIWLQKIIRDDQRHLYIADFNGAQVGMGRAEPTNMEKNQYLLSWAIHEAHRGKGLGSQIVTSLCDKHPLALAQIKVNNMASIKIAKKSGFTLFSTEKEILTFVRPKKFPQ